MVIGEELTNDKSNLALALARAGHVLNYNR
jgi:hypothetical protein